MKKKVKHIIVFLLTAFFLFGPFFSQSVFALGSGNTQPQLNQFALFPNEAQSLTDFRVYVSNFYLFSIGASILVAVMLMMIGGVVWLTSAGNQGRISKAKEYIINSIIGVVLLLGSYTLIQAINPRLVQLDDPNLPKIPGFGSCIRPITSADSVRVANATHICILSQQSECESPGNFDARRSCGDLCDEYNGDDGGCKQNAEIARQEAELRASFERSTATTHLNQNLGPLSDDPFIRSLQVEAELSARGQPITGPIAGQADIAPWPSREEEARRAAQFRNR